MRFASTIWNAGFKSYGQASADYLQGLKQKLPDSGHRVVHLVTTDPWDGRRNTEKGDIPVDELSEADLAWLNAPQGGMWASQRYLVCRL